MSERPLSHASNPKYGPAMRTLFKLAVGAAIAGALINLILRQTKQRGAGSDRNDGLPLPYANDPPRGTEGFTLAELAVNPAGEKALNS